MTKTQKQRLLSGMAYQASDPELKGERIQAKKHLYQFNQLEPEANSQREQVLKQLLGSTEESVYIEPPFYCDYGYNIHLGKDFYANYHLTILDCCKVSIGNQVMIGPNVDIYTACHPIDASLRHEAGYEFAKPVSIGDQVWIGGRTVINPGVKIGSQTIIGSGSVVTKDIPGGVIAAGNPCRVLRTITEADWTAFSEENPH